MPLRPRVQFSEMHYTMKGKGRYQLALILHVVPDKVLSFVAFVVFIFRRRLILELLIRRHFVHTIIFLLLISDLLQDFLGGFRLHILKRVRRAKKLIV